MARVTEDLFAWTPRRRRLVAALSCVWLGYLIPVTVDLVRHPPAPTATALAAVCLAVFAVCFVRLVVAATARPFQLATPYALVTLLLVGGVLMVPVGDTWRYAFPYYVVAILPSHLPHRWLVPAQLAALAGTVAVALAYGDRGGALFGYVASVAAVALFLSMFFRLLRTTVLLRNARAELARRSVSEERLRIARDLHDVLGHRLAAVALLSDLAGRLVAADPDRARHEAAEAGRIAREALDEVRATVSGFRDTTLTGELSTARTLLAAAGIGCVLSAPDVAAVPAPIAEVAGWVVREGATNVVRHSRAHAARILVRTGETVVVEVADDGCGDPTGRYGNGLTGLTERVTVLGGTVRTERVDGWYRLRAELPVPATRRAPATAA